MNALPRNAKPTNANPYVTLLRYKQWADRGLHDVASANVERLDAGDARILIRILDHIHVVDRIFQHHLQGLKPPFRAPRSEVMPEIAALAASALETDAWYVAHVGRLSASDLEAPLEFSYTNGAPARMTRGEIVLHVCMHGAYHRGNAGLLLQKNGIQPNDDRMTDFVEQDVSKPARLSLHVPAPETTNPA